MYSIAKLHYDAFAKFTVTWDGWNSEITCITLHKHFLLWCGGAHWSCGNVCLWESKFGCLILIISIHRMVISQFNFWYNMRWLNLETWSLPKHFLLCCGWPQCSCSNVCLLESIWLLLMNSNHRMVNII